jgi:predicted homoserine dehydrogenase-like protein
MIIVDAALAKLAAGGNPIRIGLIGAGFMAQGVVNQIVNSVPGIRIAVIANRTAGRAIALFRMAGVADVTEVETAADLNNCIARNMPAVTADAMLVAAADGLDAVLELTGAVEFGANVVLSSIRHGKHVVTMNAELDSTAGPILKVYADRAGVIYSGSDGDQPGVEMNLYRFVKSLGLTPLVCGNIKGLQDPYRTPTTQAGFAARWGQNPYMVTSFADGTKISFEQAIVANATGMCVSRRGMIGRTWTGHVDELTSQYDIADLRERGGIVDYVVGAKPGPGVFVLATHDDPKQKHYLNLYKLGEGPLYSFYTPYHLCHFEAPLSVARAVLFRDAVIAPIAGPRVEVVTTAKRDLREGELIDGLGGYMTYGQCENADITEAEDLLPMGVAEGCRLRRDIPKDTVLTYADVVVPEGRLIDRLRLEQRAHFATAVRRDTVAV